MALPIPTPAYRKRFAEPSAKPEHRAVVIAEAFKQCGTWRNPSPACAWLVDRETAYHAGHGSQWAFDKLAYAAAMDLLSYQSGLTEDQLLKKLCPPQQTAAGAAPSARPGFLS